MMMRYQRERPAHTDNEPLQSKNANHRAIPLEQRRGPAFSRGETMGEEALRRCPSNDAMEQRATAGIRA